MISKNPKTTPETFAEESEDTEAAHESSTDKVLSTQESDQSEVSTPKVDTSDSADAGTPDISNNEISNNAVTESTYVSCRKKLSNN